MDLELGGWMCLSVFVLGVISVIKAIGSAAQSVGSKVAETGQIIFEQNSAEITRGVTVGLWESLFGSD